MGARKFENSYQQNAKLVDSKCGHVTLEDTKGCLDELQESENHSDESKTMAAERRSTGVSKFWTMMNERVKAKAAEQLRITREEEQRRIMEMEKIPSDELHGSRIHSWVLIIINKNDIKFIEPSTGIIYDVSDSSFIGIESLWNHLNYWINMKPTVSLSEMSFELTNLEYWEHLLVAEPWHIYVENLKFSNKHDIKALKHFSMPSSWVCSLVVPKEKYEKKFPNGCKTTLYKKAKVEKFCKHREPDGIILRVTKYDDYDHRESIMIVNVFVGRSDRLEKLKRNHKVGKILEYFEYGRKDSLKSLQYVKFAKPLWNGLTMEFYSISRLNNMISLSITTKEMICNFSNRDNRLLSYLVKFKSTSPSETIEAMKEHIETIGEKFAKQNRPNTIEVREFHENRILLTYHFENKEIFQKKKLYWKEGHYPVADAVVTENAADIKDRNNHKTNELVELLRLEQQCLSEVLDLLQEADEIFLRRCLGREILTTAGKSCTGEIK